MRNHWGKVVSCHISYNWIEILSDFLHACKSKKIIKNPCTPKKILQKNKPKIHSEWVERFTKWWINLSIKFSEFYVFVAFSSVQRGDYTPRKM